jgi:hypothetical protein
MLDLCPVMNCGIATLCMPSSLARAGLDKVFPRTVMASLLRQSTTSLGRAAALLTTKRAQYLALFGLSVE